MDRKKELTLWFKEIGIKDVALVGGKNASLGEMIQYLEPKGVPVPNGFVVTAEAYRYFLERTGLKKVIKDTLTGLSTKNLPDLAKRCTKVRGAIKATEFPADLTAQIVKGYKALEARYGANTDVAVRSSATAEDLPGASFAGEHDTYLNIRGADEVVRAVRSAMASLFTERATSYRADKGFDHFKVALSVGIQKMVRSDLACSGVMFTVDTESGFKDVVLINGSWGLGEMIVQGEVTPDEFLVFKPNLRKKGLDAIIDKKIGVKNRKMVYSSVKHTSIKETRVVSTTSKERSSWILTDNEILKLAGWGAMIEEHYTQRNRKWTPMDMEWAKDGRTGELFIVQARPETVQAGRDFSKITEFILQGKGKVVTKGTSVGSKIASGKARVILNPKNIRDFKKGEVLVTGMTDPDWEPIMKIASAIVTDKGGRTSHAAIVSRELGIPCVVGTENATTKIRTGQVITVDTAGTEGFIYEGAVPFRVVEHDVKNLKKPKTKIMVNIATPDTSFEKSFLPNDGVGLAREEFIIASNIGIHPNALLNYGALSRAAITDRAKREIVREIDKRTKGYASKTQFYIDKLAYGIAKIGAAFYPNPVIVRFSDFKTNEYRTLIGGELYEPKEENPMIGWRGASRYYDPDFAGAFVLEVKAIEKVRERMGLDNVQVMIPFCRTAAEGAKVVKLIETNGLSRRSGLKIYVMCEIPANIVLAGKFLDVFDGMSIGSNDLTQLTVGIDRDGNDKVKKITNENDESVKDLIAEVIKVCRARHKYIGICGQAPSDYPEFAKFLVKHKIESMSLNPDTVIKTVINTLKVERNKK
ncbi:phosphoenolpyruvate synthase [Patescibacteria group bacterium]|nr:phosphoenolpyruvate synthase [Patescibacteria group bacterium]